MTRYAYPRARDAASFATDLLLVVVAIAVLVTRTSGPLWTALGVAIPLVLVFGVLTLHHPRAVVLDDDGIAFEGYRRTHRYAWRDVREIRVRRFLTGDRVLLRVLPSPPFRGRYWLFESMIGYRELLAELERRGARGLESRV